MDKTESELQIEETPDHISEDENKESSSSNSTDFNSNDEIEDKILTVNKSNSTKKSNNSGGKTMQLPRVDIKEKIFICLDLSTDVDATTFRFGDGTRLTPLAMLKRVINIYVYSKKLLNKKHEYALVLLHDEKATVVCNFTTNPADILSTLSNVHEQTQSENFNLSSLFNEISEVVELPKVEDNIADHTIRVLILFARSTCYPCFIDNDKSSYEKLRSSPYFFVDLLYIHEPITDKNNDTCDMIFNCLYQEVCNESSYVFNVGRNPTKLHDCMSKLLAHPLQRPLQEQAEYKLLAD